MRCVGSTESVSYTHLDVYKRQDVDIPLGVVTCVTGVSGSGKSSLVNEILYKHLAKSLNRARCIAGDHDGIDGIEQLCLLYTSRCV